MRYIRSIAPALWAIVIASTGFAQTASPATVGTNKDITDAIDRSADPCVDFYEFACGNWRKTHPLPSDRSRYGRFTELLERNQLILKEILEQAAAGGANRSANDQKIGDYYASCMDETAINQKGLDPLKSELDRINGLQSKEGLTELVTYLHRRTIPGFFRYYSQPDLKDATRVIAWMDQGGIGLPNRDYYFGDDARSKEIREKYVTHITKMLQLSGYNAEQAAAGAKAIMTLETSLAEASLTPVEERDPQIQYHPTKVADLEKTTPSFTWSRYISGVGTPSIDSLNVSVPKFAERLEKVISTTSLDDLKTYMRWHLLRDTAPLLSEPFVQENFDFFERTLRGTKEMRARWKRCVEFTDDQLGEALGIAYVEKTFPPDAKKRMLELVHNVEEALRKDIDKELDWMSPATKQQAYRKLDAIANKIGYPEKWRDYSSVQIVRGDALGNAGRAAEFEKQRNLKKIGKPVDKTEWYMSPPTVNAYYNPQENNINFPAGILQPPFFYRNLDDPVNYGAIGVVIGHEITHGFDDQGRQFDAEGNLKDWWTKDDNEKFNKKAQCFIDQYETYTPLPGEKINGKLTLGENAADNGGMRIAWMALMDVLAKEKAKAKQKIDGFTPEQRFFIGYGQVWCENKTDQSARVQIKGDPHSPGRYRAIGAVVNMPEFQKAFSCKAGQPMAPPQDKRCRVW